MPIGIYRLDSTGSVTRRMIMKRSIPWSASPIVAVVMVAAFLLAACNAGQGVASATPASASLAAGPTTSAPATASGPSASPTPSPVEVSDGSLEAGTTYFINEQARVVGPRWVVLTVPATGWKSNDHILFKTLPGGSDSAITKLSTWTVGNLKADPCRWKAGALDPPVGPTVGDLAAALIEQVGPTVATSTDATLGGYRGKKIEYSAPSDFDHSSCDEGVYSRWQPASDPDDWGGWVEAGGQRNAVYIIDVDGQRLLVDTMSLPGASAGDLAEVDQIIASIRFEPRASSPSPSP
jgi:predicted small secreted protein